MTLWAKIELKFQCMGTNGVKCRAAPEEAESYARSAQPELRTVYKKLAEQWLALASEIERFSY